MDEEVSCLKKTDIQGLDMDRKALVKDAFNKSANIAFWGSRMFL
jgi:hypothetical protein